MPSLHPFWKIQVCLPPRQLPILAIQLLLGCAVVLGQVRQPANPAASATAEEKAATTKESALPQMEVSKAQQAAEMEQMGRVVCSSQPDFARCIKRYELSQLSPETRNHVKSRNDAYAKVKLGKLGGQATNLVDDPQPVLAAGRAGLQPLPTPKWQRPILQKPMPWPEMLAKGLPPQPITLFGINITSISRSAILQEFVGLPEINSQIEAEEFVLGTGVQQRGGQERIMVIRGNNLVLLGESFRRRGITVCFVTPEVMLAGGYAEVSRAAARLLGQAVAEPSRVATAVTKQTQKSEPKSAVKSTAKAAPQEVTTSAPPPQVDLSLLRAYLENKSDSDLWVGLRLSTNLSSKDTSGVAGAEAISYGISDPTLHGGSLPGATPADTHGQRAQLFALYHLSDAARSGELLNQKTVLAKNAFLGSEGNAEKLSALSATLAPMGLKLQAQAAFADLPESLQQRMQSAMGPSRSLLRRLNRSLTPVISGLEDDPAGLGTSQK